MPVFVFKGHAGKKIDEVESAAKFIAFAVGSMQSRIPQKATLQGAWACLDDLYVHLEFRFAKMEPSD